CLPRRQRSVALLIATLQLPSCFHCNCLISCRRVADHHILTAASPVADNKSPVTLNKHCPSQWWCRSDLRIWSKGI
ncbi:hypothetical protein A2U01_0094327, partial [Trifolium medium]|nr:hypothetical protein [Trifolium medium]